MAYRKGFRGRRTRGKRIRRNPTKRLLTGQEPTLVEKIASGVGSVARLASAVMPIVAAINTENKYWDEGATFTSYGTNANADLRCISDTIPQGTTDSSRTGNSVLARDLQIRFASYMPVTPTAVPAVLGCFHRVLIFAWKYNDGGGPSILKLLEDPTSIHSPLNKDFTDQFVVLKDKFMTFNASAGIGGNQDYKLQKYYKKLDWHLRWKDDNSAIANHVWILTMSTPTLAANAITTKFYSRINYTDN